MQDMLSFLFDLCLKEYFKVIVFNTNFLHTADRLCIQYKKKELAQKEKNKKGRFNIIGMLYMHMYKHIYIGYQYCTTTLLLSQIMIIHSD